MNEKHDVIAASMIGTIVEWYGIFIFSSGTLYLAHAFYPFVSYSEAILLTLLTFALGFVARPVGALVFGHFGDKIGRKKNIIDNPFNFRYIHWSYRFDTIRGQYRLYGHCTACLA